MELHKQRSSFLHFATFTNSGLQCYQHHQKTILVSAKTYCDSHWSNLSIFTLPFLLQLLLPQPVDDDVDADVDRCADDEEQQPHVDQLKVMMVIRKMLIMRVVLVMMLMRTLIVVLMMKISSHIIK